MLVESTSPLGVARPWYDPRDAVERIGPEDRHGRGLRETSFEAPHRF